MTQDTPSPAVSAGASAVGTQADATVSPAPGRAAARTGAGPEGTPRPREGTRAAPPPQPRRARGAAPYRPRRPRELAPPLLLPEGLVCRRVDAPQALRPLPVDDGQLPPAASGVRTKGTAVTDQAPNAPALSSDCGTRSRPASSSWNPSGVSGHKRKEGNPHHGAPTRAPGHEPATLLTHRSSREGEGHSPAGRRADGQGKAARPPV